MFTKDLLKDLFNDQFNIFRGGQIINIDNSKPSKQIDIILVAKNTVKIFDEKGIFPIECVHGIFSVTATLNHPKLFGKKSIIEEFKSVPKDNPQFVHIFEELFEEADYEKVIDLWNMLFPYKCAFGFEGSINEKWAKELNDMVEVDINRKNELPDIIIVNKRGMIQKIRNDEVNEIGTDFLFTKFDDSICGLAIAIIIHDLYDRSIWQNFLIPEYRGNTSKKITTRTPVVLPDDRLCLFLLCGVQLHYEWALRVYTNLMLLETRPKNRFYVNNQPQHQRSPTAWPSNIALPRAL